MHVTINNLLFSNKCYNREQEESHIQRGQRVLVLENLLRNNGIKYPQNDRDINIGEGLNYDPYHIDTNKLGN